MLTLEAAVTAAGLTPCSFVRLRCKKCGDLRSTATETSSRYQPCPLCSTPAPCHVMGFGGTKVLSAVEPDDGFHPTFVSGWRDAIVLRD